MSPTEKKEEIRKAIISSVPEIVELKFGCRVQYEEMGSKGKPVIYHSLVVDSIGDQITISNVFGGISIILREDLKSLGRQIRLSDILAAIESKEKVKISTGSFEGSEENPKSIREEYEINHAVPKLLYLYNLRADDLELNPQTWDYLYELLINS